MINVELVGGEFDGLRFEAAEGQPMLAVPLAFNYADGPRFDGDVPRVESVEALVYEDTGRSTEDGRRLYRSDRHLITVPP